MKTTNSDGKLNVEQPVSKQIMFIVLGAAVILTVPLLARQFTDEVAWDLFDFAVAGALLAGTGLVYVLSARKVTNIRQRAVVGSALAAALLLVWMELAVGVFGTPFSGS